MTRVLGLIPARGGSKGLPRKNVLDLAGKPLIAHSIEAGLAVDAIDRVMVSTDDDEIAEVARHHGAEVPFVRPAALAEDDTPDLPVFQHALEWLARHDDHPELVVHLRPTTPLRRPGDVARAIELLDRTPEADSVRSVAEPLEHPYKMWRISDGGWARPLLDAEVDEPYNQPRQLLPTTWWHTGAIDVIRRSTILEQGSMSGRNILPLVVENLGPVDIDTAANLDFVEWMIRTGRVPWSTERPLFGAVPPPRLLVLDFDGVMTDNRVVVTEDGREASSFDRGDGMGIRLLREAGGEVVVLSTEENPIVSTRCAKLGIACRQGLLDKRTALEKWLAELSIRPEEIVYVGNDVNDLGCLELAGTAVAVADAHPEVIAAADLVLTRPGGGGAVREICDVLRDLIR